MSKLKLFEDFVYDWKRSHEAIKELSETNPHPSEMDVASYCYDNWKSITGLPNSRRMEENNFPREIEDIVDHFDLDWTEFDQAWLECSES